MRIAQICFAASLAFMIVSLLALVGRKSGFLLMHSISTSKEFKKVKNLSPISVNSRSATKPHVPLSVTAAVWVLRHGTVCNSQMRNRRRRN